MMGLAGMRTYANTYPFSHRFRKKMREEGRKEGRNIMQPLLLPLNVGMVDAAAAYECAEDADKARGRKNTLITEKSATGCTYTMY